jgi:hypothetical protein
MGYTYVHGRSRDNARALLDAARRLGLDPSTVRTRDGGYEVPNAIADELANAPGVDEDATPSDLQAAPDSADRPTAHGTPGDGQGGSSSASGHVDPGPSEGFDPQTAGYNELKAEAARRFGPGAGAGSKEELIAKLSVQKGD